MNHKFILPVLLTFTSLTVNAGDWSTEDTARQSIVLLLLEVDRRQTIEAMKYPGRYRELNTILGEYPSDKRINTHFFVSGVLHTAISYALPPDWRKGWQYITIGLEAGTIHNNYNVGIRIQF